MHLLKNISDYCPYCGEYIDILVDCSVPQQRYTEDCQVCCQPMVVNTELGPEKNITLSLNREDDAC